MTGRERIRRSLNGEEIGAMDLGGMLSTGISCFAYPKLVAALGLEPRPPKVHDTMQMLALPDADVLDALQCDVVTVDTDKWTNAFSEAERWHPYSFNNRLDALVMEPDAFSIEQDGSITQKKELRMLPSSYVFDSPHGGEPFDIMTVDPPKEKISDIEEKLKQQILTDEKIRSIRNYCRRVHSSTDRAIFFNGYPMGLGYRKGMVSWSMFCLTDPDYVKEVHELITRYAIKNYRMLIPEIAPYIDIFMANADDQGTQHASILPPQQFRDLYIPYYRRMNDALHQFAPELKSFLHSCGAIYDLIDDIIDAGFDILNPVQWSAGGRSFREWKDLCRNRISLWGGGINTQSTLPLGTIEDVKKETREVSSYLAEDGGFVFNPIHNILAEIHPDKIIAMYQEAAQTLKYAYAPCS